MRTALREQLLIGALLGAAVILARWYVPDTFGRWVLGAAVIVGLLTIQIALRRRRLAQGKETLDHDRTRDT